MANGGKLITPESDFQPTYATPIPRVQCTYVDPDGNGCSGLSLRGATVCLKHGAGLPAVQRHAASVLAAARMRLINSADEAVDTLVDLLQPGTPEGVRLKAAAEVLDRSGIRSGYELDVVVENRQSPAAILEDRLRRLKQASVLDEEEEEDVVDAEIVDD
jgi:hypothetical protein